MKKILIGVVVVAVVGIIAFGLVGNSSQDENTQNTTDTASTLTMATINTDMDAGAQLVDVRTPEEFNAGHIEGAINIPLDGIQAGSQPSKDKDTTVYVYCRSGNRSAQATTILEDSGFTNVVDLGGMNDVVALGGKQVQ